MKILTSLSICLLLSILASAQGAEKVELRVQGNGYIDRSQMHDHRQATYLTLGDLPVVVEEHDVINTCSQWKGETNYQYNGDKTYVKNNIRGYIDFNKSIGTINCNSQRTDMMVKPRKRSLTEYFQLSHTTNSGNVYNIDSYWSYMYLPGQLLTINGATEQLNLGFFSTQNAMRFKFKVGKCYLNNEAGVNFDHQNITVNANTPLMGKALYDIPIFTGYRNQTVNRGTLEDITQRQLSSGSVRYWEHYLNIHILPTQRWMISMKNELFHSSEASVSTNFFMDIALCYKRKRWELSFSVNNILGTSQFERRRLGNTIEQYAITRLRPHEWVAKWNVDL